MLQTEDAWTQPMPLMCVWPDRDVAGSCLSTAGCRPGHGHVGYRWEQVTKEVFFSGVDPRAPG